jgi:DNA-binding XRE family transcriptional regulator/predicted RNase H-like HicB family nuclease
MRYAAIVTIEGKARLAEFPDCPGCQTFVEGPASIEAGAAEALEGWLETSLEFGDAPARPSKRVSAPRGATVIWVGVRPKLAAALEVRWARQAARLSQTELGRLVGVTQQQIAKLERATGNVSIETLDRVARALGKSVRVELVPIGG